MIDLHLHTNYSDGESSVAKVLAQAEAVGLSVISLTDHGTVAAYAELTNPKIRSLFSGDIMPGVEITTHYKGEVIEILAYNFDLKVMEELLKKHVLSEEEKHEKEFPIIKRVFDEVGVKYEKEAVRKEFERIKKHCKTIFYWEFIKYPENDQFLLKEEHKARPGRFIRRELNNPKSKLFIDQSPLVISLDQAIDLVHQAGGLAFLAHPFAYSTNIVEDLETMVKSYKLDGIECLYTTKSAEQTEYIIKFCNKHNLLKSGGSDYHGRNNRDNQVGVGYGCLNIPRNLIDDWY